MRYDTKPYYDIPEELNEQISIRGYRAVTPEDQAFFDPYYDRMNDHWCANTSFLNLWGWKEAFPEFYKVYKDYLILICYDRAEGRPVAIPFLGNYTEEGIRDALQVLKEDFAAFGETLIIMDILPWMLSYYQKSGIEFEVEDLRDNMDYIFTPEEFLAGMDQQDDRYRYRYFKRKYQFETLELTKDHAKECKEFMLTHWCGDKPCSTCMCGCLLYVVDNLVTVFDKLLAKGLLVRVDGKMAGLVIVTCRNGLGIYQYKNAINSIKGLNEYLLRESFERFLTTADCINYTEDMGVESLRYYKMHMAPSYSLLSKYTLTEKGS